MSAIRVASRAAVPSAAGTAGTASLAVPRRSRSATGMPCSRAKCTCPCTLPPTPARDERNPDSSASGTAKSTSAPLSARRSIIERTRPGRQLALRRDRACPDAAECHAAVPTQMLHFPGTPHGARIIGSDCLPKSKSDLRLTHCFSKVIRIGCDRSVPPLILASDLPVSARRCSRGSACRSRRSHRA